MFIFERANMGLYLNRGNDLFSRARNSEIYVDKSELILLLNKVINTEQEFICVSRPRRFGKSMDANMISAYYDKTCNAAEDFSGLKLITEHDGAWKKYANKYHVLFINMQEFLSGSESVEGMLSSLQKNIMWDLKNEFQDVNFMDENDLIKSMKNIYISTGNSFIVIIDEWDCIFREFREDKKSQGKYLDFLRTWLKDNPCISLCYLTGILPIKKYGTQSALNMFQEYSMESPEIMAEFTGFTEKDVDELCARFGMNLEECRFWYDGYRFEENIHVYNPKSIVTAMLSRHFDDYWNRTETYEALKIYIDMNFDGLHDKIIALMSGERQHIETGSFQNDMTTFSSADDVLTLLVHIGYLGYDKNSGDVFIPNNEIMREFVIATTAANPWSEIVNSVKQSAKLLEDTFTMDEDSVSEAIEKAHLETSHIQYNDENALSYTISLAYYSARQYYTIIREFPSGRGFADLVFLPRKNHPDKPALIVELKWDKTAETAISEIRKNQYPKSLMDYGGEILLVGINYDKKTKKHECRIERV